MKVKLFLLCAMLAAVLYAQDVPADLPKSDHQVTPNVQQITAKEISDAALARGNANDAISYTKEKLGSTEELSDKNELRSTYIFLGTLQETCGLYGDAKTSYIKAAGIAGKDGVGMPPRSNEVLVLDAVRCSLATGEGSEALNFLSSAVRDSKDENIRAAVALYNIWAQLCLELSSAKEKECITRLKNYATDKTMSSVQLSILFTLWYVTGESEWANKIIKTAPRSAQAAIVTGRVQVMPSPFWYFIPHEKMSIVSSNQKPAGESPSSSSPAVAKNDAAAPVPAEKNILETTIAESKDSNERAIKEQLGLFREKNNALNYVTRLKEKGFDAYITEETRASGTTYFIVLVDEDSKNSMGMRLKSAGFECYPIFQ